MKTKYVLKKEIRDELINLGIEILGIMCMSGIILLLMLLNGMIF